MTATCDAPHRGIRGGDQKKVSAGNADGFIVRLIGVACNEWTARPPNRGAILDCSVAD